MRTEQVALQVMENMVNDLMYVYELDREVAERTACTIIKNPQLALELEAIVREKRALGA